jgi:hypothetical protein
LQAPPCLPGASGCGAARLGDSSPRPRTRSFAEFVRAFKASPVYANLASMDEIKKLFLLSTNFVQSRGNPAAPLKFTTLYSPYESPCYNPFAEAVPDQGAPAANWE